MTEFTKKQMSFWMHGSRQSGAQCGRWEPVGNWGYVLGLLGKCNHLEKGYIWSWSVCVFACIRIERAGKKYVGNFLGNIKDKTRKQSPQPPTAPGTQLYLSTWALLSALVAANTWICWTMLRSCTRNSLASLALSDSPFSAWESWLCRDKEGNHRALITGGSHTGWFSSKSPQHFRFLLSQLDHWANTCNLKILVITASLLLPEAPEECFLWGSENFWPLYSKALTSWYLPRSPSSY